MTANQTRARQDELQQLEKWLTVQRMFAPFGQHETALYRLMELLAWDTRPRTGCATCGRTDLPTDNRRVCVVCVAREHVTRLRHQIGQPK